MSDAPFQSIQEFSSSFRQLFPDPLPIVERHFVPSGADPLDGIEWEERQSLLKESDGTSAKRGSIVVPAYFSVNASDVLCQKYLRRRGVPDLAVPVDEKIEIEPWLFRSTPAAGSSFGGEKDLRQIIHRMAGCWAHWGVISSLLTDSEARALYDDSSYLLSRQAFAPNSPQWFNTGLHWAYGITGPSEGHFYVDSLSGELVETKVSYERPQPQACFIQSVDDDLVKPGGIMDLWVREARLFKYGSGTGTNFSSLRGKGETLSGGGQSSGLMSWLRIGDRSAAGIQSGGTTRRAAKMVILDVDHPEIEDFACWKATEERKVAALVTGSKVNRKAVDRVLESIRGYQTNCVDHDDRFDPKKNVGLKKALREGRSMGVPDRLLVRAIDCARSGTVFQPEVYGLDWRGEAYDTVSGQQSNNSVSIPHQFMDAALSDGEWSLIERTSGRVSKTISALGLFDQICESAWMCADPGLQFVDTMNEWNTCLGDGKIRGTNPCLPGFATMLTPDGIRPFSQICVGDIVWSGKTWTRMIRKWSTGVKPVFSFHTRAGSFIGTEDHRVVSGGEKVEAREAETIDVCLGGAEGGGLNQGPYQSDRMAQVVMDGLMLGDGTPKICNGGSDTYFLLYVGEGDQSYFSSEISELLTPEPFDGTAHRVQTTLSADELPKTYERTVPDRFFYGDEWIVRAFLRGLYSANGSVPGGRVALKASSFAVIDRVQQMLSSLGIRSYYTTNPAHDVKFGNGTYLCRESYDLNISVDRDRFRQLIGFIHPHKQKSLDEACAKPKGVKPAKGSYEIVRRDELGEHEVFDFTVEDAEHVVWSQGLLVSNCSEYVFLDDTACNLSSINLAYFLLPDGSFDLVGFESAVRVATTILEVSVSMASLPSAKIAVGTYNYRTLGLGFANLGALLMRMGIPYDSDEGRRIAAGISSFMTATAYDQSGVMASRVGPFPRWEKNRESMTRVLENHRRVANGEDPIGVTCMPPRLDLSAQDRASSILDAASKMWNLAVRHADSHGYRNAQVTCIAPTGTIAIEMDCDTTGLEPDFALVKYKTLAGGGFMKQINLSVPKALHSLGYSPEQIEEINRWVVGAGCLRDEDRQMLLDRGLSGQSITRIEKYLVSSVHLRMALLPDVIGRDELEKLQIDPSGDVASALGFSGKVLSEASAFSCGYQTVEGCPVLRKEHLPVFDCANRCGSGVRFIRPEGHLLMLSSIQPFLSGASSKTVNLPSEATQADVKRVYVEAWKLGIKCVALYVDGSKFSQPLSSRLAEEMFGDLDELDSSPSSPEHVKVVEKVVERIVERQVIRYISERRRLPNLRRGYTQKVLLGNHKVFLRTGEYSDGALGEIFVDIHKDGTAFKSLMGAFAIAVSVGLQHGVPLERFVDLFTFTKFEPNGPVQGDDRLMMCTSLLDWIFRHLAIRYLDREDLATIPKESAYDPQTVGDGEPSWDSERMMKSQASEASASDLATDKAIISSPSSSNLLLSTGEYCDSCGNFSLVRKGRCSTCSNPSCGAESGGCG